MAEYKSRRNFTPHNFNNTTITIDKTDKAEGVETLEVEPTNDEVTVQDAADGLAIFVENPSRVGEIRLSFLEASATNDKMEELYKSKATFSIDVKDSAVPDLDCRSAQCRISKHPTITRGREATFVEWVCICTYLDIKGGSYALVSA
jgi:hypothetical protein